MALLIPAEPRSRSNVRLLPPWWPLAAMTAGYPLWWALGLSAAVWPMMSALVLLPRLISSRRQLKVPSGFGWWMLFIVWVVLSTTQISALSRLFSFGYRFSVYFAATLVFLYIYNESEERLPTNRVIGLLTGLWVSVAIGGHLGAVFPRLAFPSLVELVAPRSLTSNALINALVHPEFAQVSRLFGREIGRPHALFPFTNGWGSAWGILFPVVMAWFSLRRPSLGAKLMVAGVLAISLYSVVLSLNRGLWISIVAALVYTTARFAGQRKILPIVMAVVAVALLATVLSLTSLGELVDSRSESGHSDEGRTSLYTQSLEISIERPILGWGTPQPRNDGKIGGPSVGTHGHVWLVLVSQGWVGLGLYFAWWSTLVLRTVRRAAVSDIWLHAVLIVTCVQMFFYEHTPIQLPLAMTVAAVLLRKARLEGEDREPASVVAGAAS